MVDIARYASEAKTETDLFNQVADLVVMKLSGTRQIVDVAGKISKLDNPATEEIEKEIQAIKRSADYKTLDEARAHNGTVNDRL